MRAAENPLGGMHSFSSASPYADAKYVLAHPNSDMGDPNMADTIGYELIGVKPDGLMIYRKKSENMKSSFFYWTIGFATGCFFYGGVLLWR